MPSLIIALTVVTGWNWPWVPGWYSKCVKDLGICGIGQVFKASEGIWMRTNKNYYPVYIKLNIVLDKKFVWVFSIRYYGKTCTNFLANPIEKIAINLALVWGGYIGWRELAIITSKSPGIEGEWFDLLWRKEKWGPESSWVNIHLATFWVNFIIPQQLKWINRDKQSWYNFQSCGERENICNVYSVVISTLVFILILLLFYC